MKRYWALGIIGGLVVLSGCASTVKPPATSSRPETSASATSTSPSSSTSPGETIIPFSPSLVSPAKPGNPPSSAENYTILTSTFFETQPTMWGGAYIDGDVLVIKTVGYSVEEATKKLASAGITEGMQVVASTVSLARLDELTAKAEVVDPSNIVSVGPQYATSKVAVGVREDHEAQRAELTRIDPNGFIVYQAH